LVGELLEITRVEGDPAQRKHERVEFDELVEHIVEDCQIEAQAQGSDIRFRKEVSCIVDGDPELLRRAVENVIRNGIRFTPAGEVMDVRLTGAQGRAEVTIRDKGPGVPEESLPLLFEPFYRVESDRNRASGGVGLGLSIARRAVDLHGGSIQAANAKPGLSVVIELPAELAPVETAGEVKPAPA
jgi:two-component system sensor histidine kinase CpxA